MIRKSLPLAVLLGTYLVIGVLYAYYTPDWQAPDEPAHYNYVRQIASGQLPVIEAGDYDQSYQEEVISSRFDPAYSIEPFEYEDHQPPLYYFIQAPVFELSGGSLLALRITSVVVGGALLVVVYLTGERLLQGKSWVYLTAAAFVAFLPQHVAIMASVNNDSLAELFIALVLFLLFGIIELRTSKRADALHNTADGQGLNRYLLLGFVLGLGLLTKATVYVTVPVVILVLAWLDRRDRRGLIKRIAAVFGPALSLGGLWWARNVATYGGLDIMGLAAHDRVVVNQPRTAEWIADRGLDGTIGALLRTTFQSFWGQFGWMGVVMPDWIYQVLLLFTFFTLVGLTMFILWSDRDELRPKEYSGGNRRAWQLVGSVMFGLFLLSLIAFVGYNVTYVQHQGRYLYPALLPIGIGVAIGWARLLQPAIQRWPMSRYVLPVGLGIGLVGLDLLALFRFLVPALTL